MEALKSWVLKLPWVRAEMYSKVFQAAQDDILETFEQDVEKRAEVLAEAKLVALLSPVDLKAIVKLDKTHGMVYIGNERADAGRLKNLKNEAEFLVQSDLWKLLYETPKELAQQEMFIRGEELEKQLAKGRTILYTLSAQKNIIDVFLSYTQRI